MSAHETQTQRHDKPGQSAADEQQHRQALRDLIDMGTDFARLLRAKADAQAAQDAAATPPAPVPPALALAPGAPVADPFFGLAGAFDRIARAVRRCIALARSLDEPAAPARDDPAQQRAAARRRVIREVEDAIERTGASDAAEALRTELRERLDAPDLDDDIHTRPVAEIITEIRRDLGLAALPGDHLWRRRTPEDMRQLCAHAAAPSAARQPGAGPHAPGRNAAPRCPDPQPAHHAATPRAQPGPFRTGPAGAGSDLPDDPAAAITAILRHSAPIQRRWRPPPKA